VSCESERPLVTLLLLSYNQEHFILEAIAGALAQTYSPLEIIISDDNSTDNSYSLICEAVDKYDGPHDVITIKNEQNLGIGAHINKLMQLARGEIIVASAADDISLPERVETLVAEWLKTDCTVDMLHSQVMKMTPDGQIIQHNYSVNHQCSELSEFIKTNVIIGASEAWTRRLYDRFGPLNPEVVHEDRTIGFRALLGGGIRFIETPLVKYRIGGISQPSYKTCKEVLYNVARIAHKRYIDDCRQNLADLQVADPDGTLHPDLKDVVAKRVKYHEARYSLASRNGVFGTLARFDLLTDPQLIIAALKYLVPWACTPYLWARTRLRTIMHSS
jgi:glycosyltransferase involved in cell wall biosynthesis